MIVGIDPGIHGLGVSLYNLDKQFIDATYIVGHTVNVKKQYAQEGGKAIQEVCFATEKWLAVREAYVSPKVMCLEWPQIYIPRGEHPYQSIGKAAAALWLSAVVGALCSHWAGRIVLVHPHDWKGTLPTETAVKHRVFSRMSEEERKRAADCLVAVKGSLQHNVIDALGIGMHAAGKSLV